MEHSDSSEDVADSICLSGAQILQAELRTHDISALQPVFRLPPTTKMGAGILPSLARCVPAQAVCIV